MALMCYVISVGLTQPSRVQDKHTAGVPHHLFPSSPRFSSLFSRSTLLVHVFPRVFLYMTTGLPSHDDRIHQWGLFPLCEMTVWMKISGIIKTKSHMSFVAPPLVFRTYINKFENTLRKVCTHIQFMQIHRHSCTLVSLLPSTSPRQRQRERTSHALCVSLIKSLLQIC